LVDRSPARAELNWVMVHGNEVAETLGDKRMANVVLLGALLALEPVLTLDQVAEALRNHIPARRRSLLDANLKALREGAELAARDRVLA
jgi:2-oxoglutarate ferredoxin oxidoreductase subunit gamma